MKKFTAKYVRNFEVVIEAESGLAAAAVANRILNEFEEGSVKLLSVIEEGAEERECVGCAQDGPIKPEPTKPGGKPNGSGSPGTPVANTGAPLVDQIAKAA